ncbi:ScbR family autoregulator-binding transcription factor [Streptomyces mangrovisoli]|uniref:TetR family transcriptional regulator n=1 Tax=Streptomyces mangrovisoli TaxID=1428628 RepID=A0A1J4NSX6_9ACTN|nr:ScbR family autoregulator-binding transcription factor [Streptomyces mangrovisoli]OIJ65408.1 TetR family transcriptional regulator [Streptomyces mangrovisoli]
MAQQERAIRTRRVIVEAAASVFDERGYEAATIGEILARSGVTKGALYFHFPSKQALAEGVLNEQLAVLLLPSRVCKLQELVDLGLLTAYRMRRHPVVSAAAKLSLEHGMRAQFGTHLVTAWIDTTEKLLREAQEQGELLPGVDCAESAWLFSGAWTGVQIYSHILVERRDLEERIAALFRHLLPAVAVPAVLGRLVISAERAAELGEENEEYAARLTREGAGEEPVAAG